MFSSVHHWCAPGEGLGVEDDLLRWEKDIFSATDHDNKNIVFL